MKQKQLTERERRTKERFKLPKRRLKDPIIPIEIVDGEECKEISGTKGYYFISSVGRGSSDQLKVRKLFKAPKI